MPFPFATARLSTPNVTIIFNGLIIIKPVPVSGTIAHASIGVLRYAAGHSLTVEAFVEGPEPKLPKFRFRGKLDQPIDISAKVASGATGVQKYCRGSYDDLTCPRTDDYDVHHAINLAGLEFYQATGLRQYPNLIAPGLTLDTGVLYTVEKSVDPINFCRAGSTPPPNPRKVAAAVGAEIQLGATDELSMAYYFNGVQQTFTLAQSDLKPGEKFVIYIDNSPDFVGPGGQFHDEMAEYNAVTDLSTSTEPPIYLCTPHQDDSQPGTEGNHDSAKVPCMTVLADG